MRTAEWKPHEGQGERKTRHILCEHESRGDKSIPGSRGWAGTAQLCLRCDFWGLAGCPLLSSKSLIKDIAVISNHNHYPGAQAQLPKEITAAALEWAELPNTPEIHQNPCSKRIKCIPVLANASLNTSVLWGNPQGTEIPWKTNFGNRGNAGLNHNWAGNAFLPMQDL